MAINYPYLLSLQGLFIDMSLCQLHFVMNFLDVFVQSLNIKLGEVFEVIQLIEPDELPGLMQVFNLMKTQTFTTDVYY